MKPTRPIIAAVLLVAGAAAALRAEPGRGPRDEGRRGSSRERMSEGLGLTDAQKDKLKAARRARRDASVELGAKLKASLRKLEDQLEDEAADKELTATLESVAAARSALRAENDKFEAALKSILTPSQRARMLAKRGEGRMHVSRRHGAMRYGARGHGGMRRGGRSGSERD